MSRDSGPPLLVRIGAACNQSTLALPDFAESDRAKVVDQGRVSVSGEQQQDLGPFKKSAILGNFPPFSLSGCQADWPEL